MTFSIVARCAETGMFGIAALLACAACLISLRLPNPR